MLYITETVKLTCWHKPSPLDTNHIMINILQSHALLGEKSEPTNTLTFQKGQPSYFESFPKLIDLLDEI